MLNRKTFGIPSVLLLLAGISVWHYYLRPAIKLGYVDSAIATLRTVVTAEREFAEKHPDEGYACSLRDLDSRQLPEGLVERGERNGYRFQLACPNENEGHSHSSFQIIASPTADDMAAFCVDQFGALRYDEGGSTSRCLKGSAP